MPNAKTVLALSMAALALAGCHKQQPQQNQEIAIDEGGGNNQMLANADIETLPPDESSATPSNQLQNGSDNPDVNDLGNTH